MSPGQAEVRRERQRDQGKSGKWSEEEVAVLRGLMGEGEERRGILAEAGALIPGRTKERVRGKIRYMAKQGRAQAGPSQEEETREMKWHLMVGRSAPCNAGLSILREGVRRALARLEGSDMDGSARRRLGTS